MTTQINDIDTAIKLLIKLIETSPEDPQNRLRLLTLLYTNRRKIEFFEEAFMYKTNCDLTFDTNWEKISEMGRGIDPGNGYYGKVPTTNIHRSRRGRSPTRQFKVNSDLKQISGPGSDNPDPQPQQNLQSEALEIKGSERRCIVDRRREDRRKTLSAWFGEERRKQSRRQLRRRTDDCPLRGLN